MTTTTLQRRPSERGQTLLEFALLMPLLLLLIFGVVDIARAAYISQVLSRLSREGANVLTRSSGTTARDAGDLLDALIDAAAPALRLRQQGCLYISLLRVDGEGTAELEWPEPVARCGTFAPDSRLHGRRRLDPLAQQELFEGQTLNPGERVAFVETFYQYQTLTPLPAFGVPLPSDGGLTLGSNATFFIVSRPEGLSR